MSTPLISVILPTYNEKGNILDLISEIKDLLAGRSKEIIVVDDNSPDKTADAVRGKFAGDPEVVVIVRTSDKGMAKSIRTGLEHARGSRFVVMGSDFNHLPKYIPFMVDALEHYDGVFGSRFLYGSWMSSFVHHKLSWAFNIFVRAMLGVLKPGGVIAVWTGNPEGGMARLLGRRWWHWMGQHIQYFTSKSLKKLLEDNGYEFLEEAIYPYAASYETVSNSLRRYPLHALTCALVRPMFMLKSVWYLRLPGEMFVLARKPR